MPAAISLCQLYGTYGAEQSGMEAKLFNFNAGNLTEFSGLRFSFCQNFKGLCLLTPYVYNSRLSVCKLRVRPCHYRTIITIKFTDTVVSLKCKNL